MASYKVVHSKEEWLVYIAQLNQLNPGAGVRPYLHEHSGHPVAYPCLAITNMNMADDLSSILMVKYHHEFFYKNDLKDMFKNELSELAKLRAIVASSGE